MSEVSFPIGGYTILTADCCDALVDEVHTYLAKGWTPLGGVCCNGTEYLQAMIKTNPVSDLPQE